MEQFDKMIKEMAKKEETIVPNGFDERIKGVLDNLPPAAKKGLSTAKMIMIAVAACMVLAGTAFAASPGLRGMLAEALGSFAPYAQEQEDKTYTIDGFEVKVLSALSDGSTIRAYVQVKDLQGHRLSTDMIPYGEVHVRTKEDGTDVFDEQAANGVYWSYTYDKGSAVYDKESQTALLVFTGWGQNFGDLSNARLDIRHIYDYGLSSEYGFRLNSVLLSIPLTVEAADKLTFDKDSRLARYLNAEWVELSPLGFTALFEHGTPDELTFNPIRVRLKDGTELDWERQGDWNPSGKATYANNAEKRYGTIKIWNFAEAIDLEQVESIFVCGKYFPVK